MSNCSRFGASTYQKKCPPCGDHKRVKAAASKDEILQVGRTIIRLYPHEFIVTESNPTYFRVNPNAKKNVGVKPSSHTGFWRC